jgi:hypothetical protein
MLWSSPKSALRSWSLFDTFRPRLYRYGLSESAAALLELAVMLLSLLSSQPVLHGKVLWSLVAN